MQCPAMRSPARAHRASVQDVMERSNTPGRSPVRKPVRETTPAYLEASALYYLERYSTSSEGLRRVLMRKVRRSAEAHGTSIEQASQVVDQLIARFQRSRLLDDRAFAEARARRMHEKGGSARAIKAKLGAKGLGEGDISQAIAGLDAGELGAELEAAWAYARRRKLGPFRSADERQDRRMRDMGAMARAGFGYTTAARVIDADEPPPRLFAPHNQRQRLCNRRLLDVCSHRRASTTSPAKQLTKSSLAIQSGWFVARK